MRSSSDNFRARFDQVTGRFLVVGSAVLAIGFLIEIIQAG
jgi:hypothetical protein